MRMANPYIVEGPLRGHQLYEWTRRCAILMLHRISTSDEQRSDQIIQLTLLNDLVERANTTCIRLVRWLFILGGPQLLSASSIWFTHEQTYLSWCCYNRIVPTIWHEPAYFEHLASSLSPEDSGWATTGSGAGIPVSISVSLLGPSSLSMSSSTFPWLLPERDILPR